jgi:hypothetical protein
MAKIDLNTISSGYLSQAALNVNFAAVEDEFVLSVKQVLNAAHIP